MRTAIRVGRPEETVASRNEIAVARQHVHALIQRRITHQVADAAMLHEPGRVQITPLLDPIRSGSFAGENGLVP